MTTIDSIPENAEVRLIARLRAGDPAAYEQLVKEHAPRLMGVAGRFLRCEQDRDDAVQDAFVSALRGFKNFDGRSRLTTWLHRIVVNSCLMKLRSASRRPESSIDELLPGFDETGHHVRRIDAWDDNVVSRVAAMEVRERVRACIDQLPDSYREVLLLRDIEGLDTEQTAAMLGCTQANVKTRLHRARQALRTLLEPLVAGDDSRTISRVSTKS